MNQKNIYLINGDFTQTISPLDRGFAYGDGIFRTMLMRNGQPDNWPLHYQKLVADCAVIGIVCPSADLLISDMQQLFSVTDQPEVAKIIITRGEGARGYAPPAITNPTRVIIKSAMPKYRPDIFIKGVDLHECEIRLPEQKKLAGIKHLNRLENVLARMEWNDENLFDGLMLDLQSNVIECTMSNVFARFDDILITPDLSDCGVAGITRQRIIWLASMLNLKIEIKPLSFTKMALADEVIICNSLYGALSVKKIGHKKFPVQNLAKNIRDALKA
ncbi:MAG: aminodeoxychorismate lyase [Methylotenera sp.]|uniref:aminodeoxychorismate lyase n=1 Tax=Methylotenera sp. TaxID=2051956 RepID=UPI002489E764|nr:aminodeoxychorismate lyase [Methylotenera sp.]MDI1309362.1 aminodeoxychorismate lyase [Methylotenera sp.]